MMGARYLHSYKARDRLFHYFRPPKEWAAIGVPRIRLPDDPTEAAAEAERIHHEIEALTRTGGHKFSLHQVLIDHAKVMILNAKRRSRAKKLAMTLRLQDIVDLMNSQGWRCAVSGLPFHLTKQDGCFYGPWRPSLDRIDRASGYEMHNVRIVTVIANWAMGEWGETQLRRLAKGVMEKSNQERRLANRLASTASETLQPIEKMVAAGGFEPPTKGL